MSEPTQSTPSPAEPSDAESREPDPRVQRWRPDPAAPAAPPRTLSGLWGNSDRPGYRRLYLSRSLRTYAEFRLDQVVEAVDVDPSQPPFLGEKGTRVTLRHDATVDITQSHSAATLDPFDLDIRIGRRIVSAELPEMSVLEPCLLGATPGDVLCDTSQTCGTCFGVFTCGPSDVECFSDLCVSVVEDCVEV